jgi:hypothetical protein
MITNPKDSVNGWSLIYEDLANNDTVGTVISDK